VLLHNAQKFDNDLRAGSDEDLALASLLGVVDGVEGIVQDTGFDHCGGGRLCERWLDTAIVKAEILNS